MKATLTAAIIATLMVTAPAETEAQTNHLKPKCDGNTPPGCWQKIKDHNCYIWIDKNDYISIVKHPPLVSNWTGSPRCVNGTLNGSGVEHHDIGAANYNNDLHNIVALKGKYVNGKKQGEWITLYPNGELLMKSNHKHGTLHGVEHHDIGARFFHEEEEVPAPR